MSGTERVMTVVGTRPEIIRLSRTLPLLDEAFDHILVHTGQNWDHALSQVFFDELGLRPPDRHLGADTTSLGRFLGTTLAGIETALIETRPDALVILGDTNSSIASVMARRLQVTVYHLEAGNRCFDPNVPEEINRRLVDHVADFNLVYTEHARRNLLAEGLPAPRIALTGSPMAEVIAYYRDAIDAAPVLDELNLAERSYVMASAHREENVDDPDRLGRLVRSLGDVADDLGLPVVVSTHPRTRRHLGRAGARSHPDVIFHEPFGFLDYVHLQTRARCVLSDSGTISEESAILGFPAVTLRDAIERPEAIEAGTITTAGLDSGPVRAAVQRALARHADHTRPQAPSDYLSCDFSWRVVNFIRSTIHTPYPAGIRRHAAARGGETLTMAASHP